MTRTGELAIVELQTEMKDVRKDIAELKKGQEEGFKLLAEHLEDLDKKYASKLSERVVYGLIGAILLFVLNGWLGLFNLPQIQVIAPTAQKPSTSSTTPSASATAEAQADSDKSSDSESVVDGVVNQVPKVTN